MTINYQHQIYQPRLEQAQEFQDYLAYRLSRQGILIVMLQSRRAQWAAGETANGCEIKLDRKFAKTGNLFSGGRAVVPHERSAGSRRQPGRSPG